MTRMQPESKAEDGLRPSKRLKTHSSNRAKTDESTVDEASIVRRHPLGVRPSGNALTSSVDCKRSCGLFARLPDELVVHFLETLQVPHLLKLGATCKAFHAFTRSEDLWRALFIESNPNYFEWRGTWRSTFLDQDRSREPKVDCSNLFSDVLHRPSFCAHVSLSSFVENIPEHNEIPRLDDLQPDEFADKWADQPFILRSPVKQWSIYHTWSTEQLLHQYANVKFRAESVDWPLRTYVNYMQDSHDESPLYLFDRSFVEKMNLTVSTAPDISADYWPPACFGTDAFAVLGSQRPDHRWLIVGPERSGSTFHKDPNATSAWNAVIKGSKYWIMFPSSSSLPPPPGVYVSADQSEVTSPLSIAEWLLGFHAEARATPGCKEGICGEGEVLHVPSGWYHLVLNLQPSIAITQNFVPRKRMSAVLQFLRDQKLSVSGFGEDVEDPYALFVDRLRDSDPELLEEGLRSMDRKGKWEALTRDQSSKQEDGGFSFGFGDDDDDEDIP